MTCALYVNKLIKALLSYNHQLKYLLRLQCELFNKIFISFKF